MNRKLVVLISGDSYAKAALPIIDYFKARDFEPNIVFVERRFTFRTMSFLTAEHLTDLGFRYPYHTSPLKDVIKRFPEILSSDAILLSMAGGDIAAFTDHLRRYYTEHGNFTKRPILFSGYCGLVYEKFLDGYAKRRFLDVFYVNSQHDFDLFKSYERLFDEPDDNIVLTGLPMLDLVSQRIAEAPDRSNTKKGLVFAGQTNVPFKKAERMFIVKKLVEYAEKHPNESVFLKPRCRKGQMAYHPELYHYEDLLQEISKKYPIPRNFTLTYESLADTFKRVDLCVSVSSTAVLEAYQSGLSIALLYDFGLDEKLGNAYFLESGALRLMNQIIEGERPEVDRNWMDYHLLADGKNCERVYGAVMKEITLNENRKETKLLKKLVSLQDVSGFKGFCSWYVEIFINSSSVSRIWFFFKRVLRRIVRFGLTLAQQFIKGSTKLRIRWMFRE